MRARMSEARCGRPARPAAMTATSIAFESGVMPSACIASKSESPRPGSPARSHAEMAAVYSTTVGVVLGSSLRVCQTSRATAWRWRRIAQTRTCWYDSGLGGTDAARICSHSSRTFSSLPSCRQPFIAALYVPVAALAGELSISAST